MEHLEVLNVQIFRVHIELDLGHGDVHVDAVKDLAEGGTRRRMLDAGSTSNATCIMVFRRSIVSDGAFVVSMAGLFVVLSRQDHP